MIFLYSIGISILEVCILFYIVLQIYENRVIYIILGFILEKPTGAKVWEVRNDRGKNEKKDECFIYL